MKIIVGLGNPGKFYETTRHNAGFLALDKLRGALDFPEFKFEKKFNSDISRGDLKFILVKPKTFMNESGAAVKSLVDFYKLPLKDLIIIHDDMDITFGKYKIATDSRSAGHKGVQNIIDNLGTQKFKRIRIGTAQIPEEKKTSPISRRDYALGKFSKEELKNINAVLEYLPKTIKDG